MDFVTNLRQRRIMIDDIGQNQEAVLQGLKPRMDGMVRKCQGCGALLSSYNFSQLCCPCSKKRKEIIEQKLQCSQGYRIDYLYEILELKGRRAIGLKGPKSRVRLKINSTRSQVGDSCKV
jgi:hypothetical protein